MKNNKYLIVSIAIIVISLSCNNSKNVVKKYFTGGYTSLEYSFSDFGIRNLKITFRNDSILELNNYVTKDNAPNALSFNLHSEYLYSKISINEILITKLIKSNFALKDNRYNKPYQGTFSDINNLFFNMTNDTVRFSNDFKKMQIREFCFEISKVPN